MNANEEEQKRRENRVATRDELIDRYLAMSAKIGDLLPDREEFVPAEQALEEKFADRGLEFTSGFEGMCPVQAYGIIDGMRFYFRFRSDIARIRVGELDSETPRKAYERKVALRQRKRDLIDESFANGELTESQYQAQRSFWSDEPHIEIPDGKTDYPDIIHKEASVEGVIGHPYAGSLTPAQAQDVFTKLVETLEVLPEPRHM